MNGSSNIEKGWDNIFEGCYALLIFKISATPTQLWQFLKNIYSIGILKYDIFPMKIDEKAYTKITITIFRDNEQ